MEFKGEKHRPQSDRAWDDKRWPKQTVLPFNQWNSRSSSKLRSLQSNRGMLKECTHFGLLRLAYFSEELCDFLFTLTIIVS